MVEPKVDLATGRVIFPKPEAKEKGVSVPADVAYVSVPKATMGKLAKLASKDGFVPDAETDKGKQNQTSKACRTYVLMGVEMLLAKRGS